jgi:tight adherence protein C
MNAPIIIVAITGAISIFLLAISMDPSKNALLTRMRKLELISDPAPGQHEELIDQIVSETRRSTLRSRLNEAGWYELTPTGFIVRGLGALGMGLSFGMLLLFVFHNKLAGILIGIMIGIVAWRVPYFALSRAVKARKTMIGRDLPEFLDLLASTVQAGLSLNAALVQSADAATGPLKSELDVMLSEIRLGRSREEALNALSDRINENSVTMTVSAIVQAEKLGVNLADVLQELAKESRDRRWTLAEEKAAQLPVLMIIPMALFMIPSLYLMIFGPVIAEFVSHR